MAPFTFLFNVLLLLSSVTHFPTVAQISSTDLGPEIFWTDESSSSAPTLDLNSLGQGRVRQKSEATRGKSQRLRRSLLSYSGGLTGVFSDISKGVSRLGVSIALINSSQCKLFTARACQGSWRSLVMLNIAFRAERTMAVK